MTVTDITTPVQNTFNKSNGETLEYTLHPNPNHN